MTLYFVELQELNSKNALMSCIVNALYLYCLVCNYTIMTRKEHNIDKVSNGTI